MTYEEFKKEFRGGFPQATNSFMKEAHRLEYPEQYLADTNVCPKEKEGINPMYDNITMPVKAKAAVANAQIINAAPVEATQRDYAIQRIKAIGEEHVNTLREQFHINNKYPKTFLELEAVIKSGDYTVSNAAKDTDADLYNILYGVKFGKPADKDGFDAARKILKAASQKALDKATLGTIDTLEATIDDFEAWVYNPAV